MKFVFTASMILETSAVHCTKEVNKKSCVVRNFLADYLVTIFVRTFKTAITSDEHVLVSDAGSL